MTSICYSFSIDSTYNCIIKCFYLFIIISYTTIQNIGVSILERSLFWPRMHLFDQKYNKTSHAVNLYFKIELIPVMANHANMLICCSRNISYYYKCGKQLYCLIFLCNPWYFFNILWSIESSKRSMIHAFTVTFDQFNASLMKKGIHLFHKIFWTILYFGFHIYQPKITLVTIKSVSFSFSLIYLYSTFKNDRANQSAAQKSRIKPKVITQN